MNDNKLILTILFSDNLETMELLCWWQCKMALRELLFRYIKICKNGYWGDKMESSY
jgi:hypothetical protein